MEIKDLLFGLIIMAGVSYLCRFPTLVLFRKPIKNPFIQSFLYYLPYSVLTIMIFPAIFFSTGFWVSALAGTIMALLFAFLKRGLFTVALVSVLTVLLVELLKNFFF